MATVKEITQMCKNGNINEAYDIAKNEYNTSPQNVWNQRGLGWALYYKICQSTNNGNYNEFIANIEELNSINLDYKNDELIFQNVAFQIGKFVKLYINPNANDTYSKLSSIFSSIKNYEVVPSLGYSYLLDSFIKFYEWGDFPDFINWWDLNKLRPEDYQTYITTNKTQIMALAERAYIYTAKSLIATNDHKRIRSFLLLLDALIQQYPQMVYPRYYYGKLLLALGSGEEETLNIFLPFARKKIGEFWVWLQLSEMFCNDKEKQLACLLRAVNCHTNETFLGKVRIKLAAMLISRHQYDCARFHIDAVVKCYSQNGWRLPHEIDEWIHQPWINVAPNSNPPIANYEEITNEIIFSGTQKSTAIITYIDSTSKRASIIYGKNKRTSYKPKFQVEIGSLLNIYYESSTDNTIKIVYATRTKLTEDLSYIKRVEGTIEKKEDKTHAFLRVGSNRYFLPPDFVQKNKVQNGEEMRCIATLDYNKKKEQWNWVCIKKITKK